MGFAAHKQHRAQSSFSPGVCAFPTATPGYVRRVLGSLGMCCGSSTQAPLGINEPSCRCRAVSGQQRGCSWHRLPQLLALISLLCVGRAGSQPSGQAQCAPHHGAVALLPSHTGLLMGALRFPVSPLLSRGRAGSLSWPRCVRAGHRAAELLGEVLSQCEVQGSSHARPAVWQSTWLSVTGFSVPSECHL